MIIKNQPYMNIICHAWNWFLYRMITIAVWGQVWETFSCSYYLLWGLSPCVCDPDNTDWINSLSTTCIKPYIGWSNQWYQLMVVDIFFWGGPHRVLQMKKKGAAGTSKIRMRLVSVFWLKRIGCLAQGFSHYNNLFHPSKNNPNGRWCSLMV